jgi:hypothetical protein
MDRTNWLWMRASVALMAAAAMAMRLAAREAEATEEAPEPDATPS